MSNLPKRPDCESCAIGEDLLRHNLAAPAAVAPPSAPPADRADEYDYTLVHAELGLSPPPETTAPTATTPVLNCPECGTHTYADHAESRSRHCRSTSCGQYLKSVTPVASSATPHPEDFCERCGRENCTWFAPSELWNRAALVDGYDPMLCPTCFIKAAKRVGINPTSWMVAPEVFEDVVSPDDQEIDGDDRASQKIVAASEPSSPPGGSTASAVRSSSRPVTAVASSSAGGESGLPHHNISDIPASSATPTPGPTHNTLMEEIAATASASYWAARLASSQQEVERLRACLREQPVCGCDECENYRRNLKPLTTEPR